MKKHKKPLKNKTIFWVILIGIFLKILRIGFKRKKSFATIKNNLEDFAKGEKKEVEELKTGKEGIKKYCHDSFCLFKNYFIPNKDNSHKPKILQHKSLAVIVIALAILKLSVTGYLYFIYPNQAKMSEEMVSQVLELINRDRVSNNLEPLALNKALSASALAKADDMAINNYFAHYSPSGKKPWDWINRDSYPYLFVGENLAINFASAEAVHAALMNSPSHKKNILNDRYQDVGLAITSGEIDGERTNILVELFAVSEPPKIAVNTEPNITAGATKSAAEIPQAPAKSETKVLASEELVETSSSLSKKTDAKAVQPLIKKETKIALKPRKQLAPATSPESAQTPLPKPKVIMFGEGEKISAPKEDNPIMESEKELNNNISYFASFKSDNESTAVKLISISKYIYLAVLMLLIFALLVNIVVKISVQHKPVIIQTVFTIIFVAGLLMIRLHLLEQIGDKIALL